LRHTLNLNSDSGSRRKTLTVFSSVYKLFYFSLPLSAKRARVYFQSFTNSFTFHAKRACFYFQAFTNSFFAKKTPLFFLFIDLRTLFCKMSFFLKGPTLMAINPRLPYPRLRCQFRTHAGRQAWSAGEVLRAWRAIEHPQQ